MILRKSGRLLICHLSSIRPGVAKIHSLWLNLPISVHYSPILVFQVYSEVVKAQSGSGRYISEPEWPPTWFKGHSGVG